LRPLAASHRVVRQNRVCGQRVCMHILSRCANLPTYTRSLPVVDRNVRYTFSLTVCFAYRRRSSVFVRRVSVRCPDYKAKIEQCRYRYIIICIYIIIIPLRLILLLVSYGRPPLLGYLSPIVSIIIFYLFNIHFWWCYMHPHYH
jgi:hypothetical protein